MAVRGRSCGQRVGEERRGRGGRKRQERAAHLFDSGGATAVAGTKLSGEKNTGIRDGFFGGRGVIRDSERQRRSSGGGTNNAFFS